MSAKVSVLKALQEAVAAVDVATELDAKAARKSSQAATESRRTAAAVVASRDKRDKLAAAADLLAPDWRDWPWVRESGFGAKVPRVPSPENE